MSWMKYICCVLRLKTSKNKIQREAHLEDFTKCIVGNISLMKYEMAACILKISCNENSEIFPHKKSQ